MCVCTEMQKNVALGCEFGDLLKNLNKPFSVNTLVPSCTTAGFSRYLHQKS